MKPFRLPLTAIALVIALAFAFMLAGPAFAQDELPPAPEATPAAEPAPVVEEAAPEAAPVEEPLSVEEPPAAPVEEPLPVEEPAAVVVEEEAPSVEEPVVEAAPEIVALDEGGGVLPLASEAAAETVATGDPYFKDGAIYRGWSDTGVCAAIVLPANCINSPTPLQAALTAYKASVTATGAIYLEADTYTLSADLIIDPTVDTNLVDLTGLIGSGSGLVTINFANNFHMIIQNMPAGFTLQGMTINGNDTGGLVEFTNNKGNLTLTDLVIKNITNVNADGLTITTNTGNVTLNTVIANDNYDEGASITGVTGSVTINNSSFDGNGQTGSYTDRNSLKVESTGAISINGSSASSFGRGNGAYLKSNSGITIKNSMFNSNSDSDPDDDFGYGLRIDPTSKGNIVLDNVFANSNERTGIKAETSVGGSVTLTRIEARFNHTGVEINNCFGSPCSTTAGAVSLTNLTLNNRYGNLKVSANGAITLNSIYAIYAYGRPQFENGPLDPGDPGFGGIILDNSDAKSVSAVTLNNVTSQYTNVAGVRIESKGAVTLNHIHAEMNQYGAADGIYIDTLGIVTIASTLGENNASDNYGRGIYIRTLGAVNISKTSGYSNKETNLDIDNSFGSGGVTITTGDFSGSNNGNGVVINSKGAITLTDVDSNNNKLDGINLTNDTGSIQPVTIKATGTQTNNIGGNEGNFGLFILSKGAISASGLYIDSSGGSDNRVELRNTGGTAAISLSSSELQDVNDTGSVAAVRIYSKGSITVAGVSIQNPTFSGLLIDNCNDLGSGCTTTGTPGVTATGLNIQNYDITGLDIFSKGAVKLTNILVYGNSIGVNGVRIATTGAVTIDKTVTDRNKIYGNTGNGLKILTGGAVLIKDTNVYSNGGIGASISEPASVSVFNSSFYSNTGGYGLSVTSKGAITLTGTEASNNSTYGVILSNPTAAKPGITITGSSSSIMPFTSNPSGNISIMTYGPLNLSHLHSSGSPAALYVLTTVGNLTLNNLNFSNSSGGDVISIQSEGIVTVSSVITSTTSGIGLLINNTFGSAKSVTVTDFQDTGTSAGPGGDCALCIFSNGVVTITDFNVTGNDMRDNGIYVVNSTGTKTGVTIKKSPGFDQNYAADFEYNGVYIESSGQVTVDSLYLDSNSTGITVLASGGVTVTNSESLNNFTGMNISARGAIILSQDTVTPNDGIGVILDNSLASPAAPVTVTNLWVDNNDNGGLMVRSAGAVSITNLFAGSQHAIGYALDIDTDGSVTMNATGTEYWQWNDLADNYQNGGTITAGGNVILNRIVGRENTNGSGLTVVSEHGSVTITDAWFNDNKTFGLDVTAAGAITLTNVDASGNKTEYGAILDNDTGTSGITINGKSGDYSSFNNNKTINLVLKTYGSVTMNYVMADSGLTYAPFGIQFPSTYEVGNVTLNHIEVIGTTGDYGLYFESNGTVSLSNSNFADNGLGGVYIDNTSAGTPKNVTILNVDIYGSAGEYGLYVASKGVISITDVTASGANVRQKGIWLDNTLGSSAGVTLAGLSPGSRSSSTSFTSFGLHITSNGPVSLSNFISAQTSTGVWVDNRNGTTGTGSISLSYVDANICTDEGVYIRTNGNTTLSNMYVYNNGNAAENGIDVQVDVTSSGFSGTVNLTNLNLSSNRGDEVHIVSHRAITAKNLDTYDYSYSGIGAYISTDGGGVSILAPAGTDWNTYLGSLGAGLWINATGDVVLQKISQTARFSSASNGVDVTTTGKVTVTNMTVRSNGLDGLYVDAGGAISISGLEAQYNKQTGLQLINNRLGSTGGVTVTSSTISNNYDGSDPAAESGLVVLTNGAVLLNQVSAIGNSGYGVNITVSAPSKAVVTVNKSIFNYNGDDGLSVASQGNITINGITATQNYGTGTNGVLLDNSLGSGLVSVLSTLGLNNFNENPTNGLAIFSSNVVTIVNVTAQWNGGSGVKIVNDTASVAGTGAVTITGAKVNHNGQTGISILSYGIVTLSNVEVLINGQTGIGYSGIEIDTNGFNATVQNSLVSGNGKNGIYAVLGGLTKTLTVKKTYFVGNSRWAAGFKNIETDGKLVIVY